MKAQPAADSHRRFLAAAVLLGVGLGGFFDGIVLHQILQWHHMVSSPTPPDTLANLQANTLADGLFHALTWVVTISGVWVLLASNEGGRTGGTVRQFFGGMLIGWGGFNVIEGLVNHHVLGLHHVRPGPDGDLYDLGFLVWGAIMFLLGCRLVRRPGLDAHRGRTGDATRTPDASPG